MPEDPKKGKKLPSFIRTKEDFTCEHCGHHVKGTGYTNHCPSCLWSKHVDVDPGDRKATCGGMMQPVSADVEGTNYVITHICIRCDHKKKNSVAPGDDFDKIARLVKTKPKPNK